MGDFILDMLIIITLRLGNIMEKLVIVNEVKKSLGLLNQNKPFINFDIGLSQEEINNLNNMRIDTPSVYDNFGKLDHLINELDGFVKSLNKNNANLSKLISILINKLVNDIVLGFQKETAWVTIRSSIATNLWDSPRWHTDGYYYSPYIGAQYKVSFTLKGPASLFYPLPYDLRQKFNSLQFDPENREKIANMLETSQAISAIAQRQGTIYIVGTNYAAVHSEPPIHEERLFLSIVPGSKSEIQELYNNWHPKE